MKRINLSETNPRTINTHIQHIQQLIDTTEVGETVLRTNAGVDAIVVTPNTAGQMITIGDGVQVGSPLGGDLGPGTLNVEGQVYVDGTPISYDPTTTGLNHLVEDLTPQLGGDLDLNGHTIIGLTPGIGGIADLIADLSPQLGSNLDLNAFGIGTATIPQVITIGSGSLGNFGVNVDVGAQYGTITLQSSSPGNIGPFFRTYANKTGASNDTLGGLVCFGQNSVGASTNFAELGFKIEDATSGTETASLYLNMMAGGATVQSLTVNPYGLRINRGSSSGTRVTDTTPNLRLYRYETGTGYRGSTLYSEFHKYGGGGGAYGQAVWGVAISHEGTNPDFIEGGRFHGIGQSGAGAYGLIAFAQNTTATLADTIGIESEVRTAVRDAPDPGPWAPGPMVTAFLATCREGSTKFDICYHCNQSNTTPARVGYAIGQNSVDHTGFINWAGLVYGVDLNYGSYSAAPIRLPNNRFMVARNSSNSADLPLLRAGGDNTVSVGNSEVNIRGGVCIGWPTGYFKGVGTLNCAGDVYKNNSAFGNPDYALEHYFTGTIKRFKDNEGAASYRGLVPLDELEDRLQEDYRLPNMSRAEGIGVFQRADMVLEKLEEAYLYIIQLHKRIEAL